LRPRGKARRTRFACPRCGQSGLLLSAVAARDAECVSCNLPLFAGPDEHLHDSRELAEVKRHARAAAQAARATRGAASGEGRARGLRAVALACLALGGLAGWWMFSSSESPDSDAERFTGLCLAGDWESAEEYLADDDFQRAEFRRWRILHFASIVDRLRPAGDRVLPLIEPVTETATSRVLDVALVSPFVGRRAHRQHWEKSADRWTFDASASLEDRRRPDGATTNAAGTTTPAAASEEEAEPPPLRVDRPPEVAQ